MSLDEEGLWEGCFIRRNEAEVGVGRRKSLMSVRCWREVDGRGV